MEKALLRERIHTVRRDLDGLDKQLLDIFYKLSSNMHRTDWDKIDSIPYRSMENEYDRNTVRQKLKFESVRVNKPETLKINSEKVVINLSDWKLSTEEQNVLVKGGNHAVIPKEISKEQ